MENMNAMLAQKRKSGIPLIGDLPWGSHFCQFYRTAEDLVDILVPYLRAGLENNEFCLWITSGMSSGPDAESALKAAMSPFGEFAQKGRFEAIPYDRWRAMEETSGGAVVSMLGRTGRDGFDGLRLACTAFPGKGGLEAIPRNELDAARGKNVLALFAYPHDEFNALGLMEVVKNHHVALVRNAGEWEVIETAEARIVQVEAEVLKLNEELKGKVVELSAANAALRDSRRAALNLMEDAVMARRQAEEASAGLRREIDERRRAEEELAKAKRALEHERDLLRTIFDTVPIGLAIANDPLGRHIRGNRANERILGLPSGSELSKRVPGEVAYRVLRNGKELPVDQLPMQRACRGETVTGETIDVTREDGREVTLYASTSPLLDEKGQPRGAVGAFLDITELKQAEAALQRSNARLDLLAETAGRLLSSGSPQLVVDDLCQKVMAFLDCHAFFNFLADEEAGRLCLNAYAGVSEEEAQGIEWLDYGVAICGCAAQEGCRIVAEDIPNTPDPRTELVKSYGILAYACHPLMAQGEVIGTISFGTRTRSHFTDDELALMKAVADQVAIAMERKRAEEKLRRAHDELELRVRERTEELAATIETLLGEMTQRERVEESLRRLNRLYAVLSETDQAIVRAGDRYSLFSDFCRIAVEHGGFLLSWVGLVDEADGRLQVAVACGATGYLDGIYVTANEEAAGQGPGGTSIREGTYCICNDFQNDPRTRPWHDQGEKHGVQSSASIALREDGRVIGALTLYAGERDFFDEQHVALLRQMGADISFALDNLKREARRREAELALREKEQLLMQQSRQAALGETIGNIAHQWRQPLNALGLTVQQLGLSYECGRFSKEQLETSIAKVMEIISHMSQTIDDFRNFYRPDKEKDWFKVYQVVAKTVSLVEANFREHRIGIEVPAADNLEIKGYPNEYAQVLLNILMNARDAFLERKTANARVTIRLTREGERSVVTVTDNAGGIAPEIMERIFDPYFTTKEQDLGTGIGLFMAKTIIEKNMGGRLTARNVDDGAEFRIEV